MKSFYSDPKSPGTYLRVQHGTIMRILRILKILTVVARHRLDRLLPREVMPFWLRILASPLKLFPVPGISPSASLRTAFEDLGPIFIKFGQILSTRRDLFESETADELQKLQDQVPPFPSSTARTLIEQSLGQSIEEVFNNFLDTPLASASVAQVHCAVGAWARNR